MEINKRWGKKLICICCVIDHSYSTFNIILFKKILWIRNIIFYPKLCRPGPEYSEVTEDDITAECFLIYQYLGGNVGLD